MSVNYFPKYNLNTKQVIWGILIIFCCLLVLRYRVFVSFNTHVLGGAERDAGLYLWLLENNSKNIFSKNLFSPSVAYPYQNFLAWSDNYIFPSLIYLGLKKLGFSLIASHNLLILGATFLSAWFTFLLCYSFSGVFLSSLLAGLMLINLSYFSEHLGHPQLQYFFFIPLTLYLLMQFLKQKCFYHALLIGLSITACFLTSVYYSVFLILIIIFYLLFSFIIKLNLTKKDLIKLFLGIGGGAAPVIYFVIPYFEVAASYGARKLYEAHYLAASIISYFSATNYNLLYSKILNFSPPEKQLFAGVILLFLALFSFFRCFKPKKTFFTAKLFLITFLINIIIGLTTKLYLINALLLWLCLIILILSILSLKKLELNLNYKIFTDRNFLALFLSLAFCFYFLSLGPLGDPEIHQTPLGLYALLYYLIPGVAAVRSTARFGIVAIFFIIICYPLVIKAYKKIPSFLIITLAFIAILENQVKDYPLEPLPKAPNIFSTLTKVDFNNSSLMILPMAKELNGLQRVASWSEFARINVNYMRFMVPYNLKLVNAYSGIRTKIIEEFPYQVKDFPNQIALNSLASITNLDYIIYLGSEFDNFSEKKFEEDLSLVFPKLEIISKDQNSNYLLKHNPETLLQDKKDFYLFVPSYANQELLLEFKPVESTKLNIYIDNYYDSKPYQILNIESSGKLTKHKIQIPQTKETVNPLIFRFEAEKTANVILTARKVQ